MAIGADCIVLVPPAVPPASWKMGRGRAEATQADQDKTQAEATYQGCAAAGHSGCCTEGDCKAASGCYCDVTCYYFRTCCSDITDVGCYRKNTAVECLILWHCMVIANWNCGPDIDHAWFTFQLDCFIFPLKMATLKHLHIIEMLCNNH